MAEGYKSQTFIIFS